MPEKEKTEIKTIPIAELKIGDYQVWSSMSPESFRTFAEDIAENGVENVIHIDENYVIIDGHHRYQAAKENGITELTAKVHYGLSEEDKLGKAHRLNVQTREISREEKIAKAIELRKEGRSYRQIGEWLGVGHVTISRWCGGFSTVPDETVEKVESSDGKQRPSERPTETTIEQRRQRVAELREQGAKIADIAEQVGASVGTVHNDIKAIKKAKEQERKAQEEKERVQELDMLEFEAKLNEERAPQKRDDEEEFSPNNKIINARKVLLTTGIEITSNFNTVEEADEDVRESYLEQVRSLVKSGLITLGRYEKSDDSADLIALCLEIIEKLEGGN